jgi:hypothetical protein
MLCYGLCILLAATPTPRCDDQAIPSQSTRRTKILLNYLLDLINVSWQLIWQSSINSKQRAPSTLKRVLLFDTRFLQTNLPNILGKEPHIHYS